MNPKQVSILALKENVGKAEAIRQGMLSVCDNIAPNYVAFLDADLIWGQDDTALFYNLMSNALSINK